MMQINPANKRIILYLHSISNNYHQVHEGPLSLIYDRTIDPAQWRILISWHIDSVYQKCFVEEAGNSWKGIGKLTYSIKQQ